MDFQPLQISGESGWVDLRFGLLGHEINDEMIGLTVGSRHADRELAFNLIIPRNWTLQAPAEGSGDFTAYESSLWFASIGPQSDTFLGSLASIYGVENQCGAMAECTEVGALSLKGNPENIPTSPVSLKLFFGCFKEFNIPYAEWYLNIDLGAKLVQLNEKDPEYRHAICEGLSQGTGHPFRSPSENAL